MRFKRFDWDGSEPVAIAEEIRALQPALGEVSESVGEIIEEVRSGGDEAVAAIESRFGGGHRIPDAFASPTMRWAPPRRGSSPIWSPRSTPPRPTSARWRRPSSPRTTI